jgi:hypothetical protein
VFVGRIYIEGRVYIETHPFFVQVDWSAHDGDHITKGQQFGTVRGEHNVSHGVLVRGVVSYW